MCSDGLNLLKYDSIRSQVFRHCYCAVFLYNIIKMIAYKFEKTVYNKKNKQSAGVN